MTRLRWVLVLWAVAVVVAGYVIMVRSSHAAKPDPPRCTGGASSQVLGRPPVTTWYPPGCVHP